MTRRRMLGGLTGAAVLPLATALAGQSRYVFDQSVGTLTFLAHHLGLFTSTGHFDRFQAEVLLDPRDATRASVDVVVETGSVSLDWPGAVALLRSADFFDVAAYPTARFRGTARGLGVTAAFPIVGDLSLRGITLPFPMQSRLVGRAHDPVLGADFATFAVKGSLSRSAYGMTADPIAIGDAVQVGMTVRLRLADGVGGAGPAHAD